MADRETDRGKRPGTARKGSPRLPGRVPAPLREMRDKIRRIVDADATQAAGLLRRWMKKDDAQAE